MKHYHLKDLYHIHYNDALSQVQVLTQWNFKKSSATEVLKPYFYVIEAACKN